MSCPTCGNERRPYCNNCNPDAFVERQTDFTDREMMESTIARLTAERDELLQSRNAERNRADRAEGERDDFISKLAEAVSEQGRLENQLRDANAAGVVLAKEAHHSRKCWIVTNTEYTVPSENVDALADARVETDENPTAAAWLAKAKEQANGTN